LWKKLRRPIGAKLAVAEESDQREFAETLADQRDVVVGRAEEPAPRPAQSK